MIRQKRPTFTSAELELQLAQITLDPTSSTAENLEAIAPLIKSVQDTDSEQIYLRSLDTFVEEKEKEIQQICEGNYEDFVSSVSTLLTIRQGTGQIKRRIGELDGQMGDVGRSLGEKKRALLEQKKVARNMDDAIETLQTCLRLLDLVHRVGEMIREGKYWGALRMLDDLLLVPPQSISQTPFYTHLSSSLPSLRVAIKDAVTASTKSWLFEVRESGARVGKLALEHMSSRIKRWRTKREKEGGVKLARVGGALEMVYNERLEFDALNNETVKMDFKPLFQCMHIYEALGVKSELQKNYQEDRKTQANLILSSRTSVTPANLVNILPTLMQELVGFFIIEHHVLETSPDFRTRLDVDELWDEMCKRIVDIMGQGLKGCEEPEVFLGCKGNVLLFVQTLEGYGYEVDALNGLLITLFERYSELLLRKFSIDFDQIVTEDDNQPMMVNDQMEFDQLSSVCWLATGEAESLATQSFPQSMPFSQTYPMCCINIRNFVDQFYQFTDGVDQQHVNIDEVLRKSLDDLLTDHVSAQIIKRLTAMSNLSQIAQIVVNIEHFATACDELETVLMGLRATQRGGPVKLKSSESFKSALTTAESRIDSVIASKLDSFFELAEYDWLPARPQSTAGEPSTYVFEMITFLTAYVDSVLLGLNESIKTRAYKSALSRINNWLMGLLCGQTVPRYNESALASIMGDVSFIEIEIKRLDRKELDSVFDEVKQTINIILSDAVSGYLEPSIRSISYSAVKPARLSTILLKLSRGFGTSNTTQAQMRAEKRRKEADEVGRLTR
ncbi:putative exocyst complex subunit Sec15 [Kockovaella imperatae]|uniref:Exocyst complex component SEC15 n=1 Tax=Kockovaella imperatae TaxID=4999 RepID=A0A1Y1UFD4_9TREE|nr:putative exocyst complex subunit Sec15 [Kockovaella imperatae]ORX36771.1 putative exocyst complex subunit Sec15 [Kockovaella imperatae]